MATIALKHASLILALAAGTAVAPAQAGNGELARDLDEARTEIRTELAQARAELEAGNLDVGRGLHFGSRGERADGDDRPPAEITPNGDFLVDGQPVTVTAAQRSRLLGYRTQVLGVARAGIDVGEAGALAAVDAVDRGLFSLIAGALSGSLERRIERQMHQTIEPGIRGICARMPALVQAQQVLATEVPEFRPYASLEMRDAEACHEEISEEFAVH